MATRTTFSGSSTDVPWDDTPSQPEGFGDKHSRLIDTLFDASCLPLTSVGGTANDVTASMDPVLPPGGLVDGMKVTLTWAANNTGPMTLAINGGSAVSVVDASGTTMTATAATAGVRAMLEYIGGVWRVLSSAGSSSGGTVYDYQVFTTNGTWTKPAGLDPDQQVRVQLWAAGGGGGASINYRAGAGGGYKEAIFRAADLASTVAIAIGAGGAIANDGGNSTFGTYLTAYAGAGASFTSLIAGGGGMFAKGTTNTAPNGLPDGISGGGWPGKLDNVSNNSVINYLPYGPGLWGGGANMRYQGGANDPTGEAAVDGMSAIYGGAGGATSGANPGVSVFGGDGGAAGSAGQAPGGGGGSNAPGARGECRIWIG